MTPEEPKDPGGVAPLPPELPHTPEPASAGLTTVLRLLALAPMLALACLSFISAFKSLVSVFLLAFGLGLGWFSLRFARRTWRIHRGLEPPHGFPSLLKALAALLVLIGVIAALAIPKFAELTRGGTEGATRGNLGALRSALSIYYGDLEGQYPDNLGSLTIAGKYLTDLPKAKTPGHHRDSSRIRTGPEPDDAGGWLYNNTASDVNFGTLLVNCTHTDTKSSVWTTY